MLDVRKSFRRAEGQLALAVTWEAKEGEADTVAEVLRRMVEAMKVEPGTLLFWPHRSPEIFTTSSFFTSSTWTKRLFAAHQQTEWFKRLVLGKGLPRLARRERQQFKPFGRRIGVMELWPHHQQRRARRRNAAPDVRLVLLEAPGLAAWRRASRTGRGRASRRPGAKRVMSASQPGLSVSTKLSVS